MTDPFLALDPVAPGTRPTFTPLSADTAATGNGWSLPGGWAGSRAGPALSSWQQRLQTGCDRGQPYAPLMASMSRMPPSAISWSKWVHDLVLGDHDVAQSGFDGVALDPGTSENGSALPVDGSRPHDAGTVAQFVAGDVGGELPTCLIANCAGSGGSRAEVCSACTLRKVLEMRAHILGDGGASTLRKPSEASRERL